MEKQLQERVDAFTETVVQVIGTGLPGETVRTVIEALAMRFATQVRQEAPTTTVKVDLAERFREQVAPAEQPDRPVKLTNTDGLDPPAGKAWQDAATLDTPWGEDTPKPKAALTDAADPT